MLSQPLGPRLAMGWGAYRSPPASRQQGSGGKSAHSEASAEVSDLQTGREAPRRAKNSAAGRKNRLQSRATRPIYRLPNTHVPVVVCRSAGIWTRGQSTALAKIGSRRRT